MSWPAEFMPSKETAGIAFALINSMGAIGGFFGPVLLGYVRSTVALSILGMLLIGSGVGLVLFNPNYHSSSSRKNKSSDQELVPILKS
jgi:nitrate/nitrite transporter NarK